MAPLPPSPFLYRVKGTCERGQTSAQTGCTPAIGEGSKKPTSGEEPEEEQGSSREWSEQDGGGEAVQRARGTASMVAAAFGIPEKPIKFYTDDSGKTYGEHGSEAAYVVNGHLPTKPVGLNFKAAPGVTEGEHIAAHEVTHQAYSADPELGKEMQERLSQVKAEYGWAVSVYGSFEGKFENLIELGAAYVHSPEELKKYSPEMFSIAEEWVSRLRKGKDGGKVKKTKKPKKPSDKLRDQERPNVLGYDLNRSSLTPKRETIDTSKPGDHGADPLGDGTFRMVPSGDIVDYEERNRRLEKRGGQVPPSPFRKRLPLWSAKTFSLTPDDPIKVHLPDLSQHANYTCGASAMESICEFFGVGPETEEEFMGLLGSDPEEGTDPQRIIDLGMEYGLGVDVRQGMTIDDLKAHLDEEHPILVLIQAWGEEADEEQNYPRYDDGHYVVVVGYDAENVYVEDPSLKGVRGVLKQQDFLERWHDEGGGKRYERWGAAFSRAHEYEPVKSLVSSSPFLYRVKGSYFGECERDNEGHCLPSGQVGAEKTDEEKPEESRKESGDGGEEKQWVKSEGPILQAASELVDRFQSAKRKTRAPKDEVNELAAKAAGFESYEDYSQQVRGALKGKSTPISGILQNEWYGEDYGRSVYERMSKGDMIGAAGIVAALASQDLPEPMTLIRFDTRVGDQLKPGDKFNFQTPAAFTSHPSAGVFSGEKIVVRGAVKGTRVSAYSMYPAEGEVFSYHPTGYTIDEVKEELGRTVYYVTPNPLEEEK